MRKIFVFILPPFVLTLLFSVFAFQIEQGRVLKIKDGDTVVIAPLEGGQIYTCRLYGIDAPEISHRAKPGQPYGNEAKDYLKRLVLGKITEVAIFKRDRYNRKICTLYLGHRNINLIMVRNGYAWAYRRYLRSRDRKVFVNAEKQARIEKLGLWQDPAPEAPWNFRKRFR